jgi:7-carboxy-7-deazaguanine synthase
MLVVREHFTTLQGEGSKAGAPALFVRFASCNLWSGHEHQRALGKGACASWCDTDFASGTKYDVQALVDLVLMETEDMRHPFVVLTGGEPLLQLRRTDGEAFVSLLKDAHVGIAVETNGTVEADVLDAIHHVTVSPKALARPDAWAGDVNDTLRHIVVRKGTDLKVVVPQWSYSEMDAMFGWKFAYRFVQPLDTGDTGRGALEACIEAAKKHGARVSVQTHKLMGLP